MHDWKAALLCFCTNIFLPDQGDEGCSWTLLKCPDARFDLKSHKVLNFIWQFIAEVYWLISACWTWWGFSLRVNEMFILSELTLVHLTKETVE